MSRPNAFTLVDLMVLLLACGLLLAIGCSVAGRSREENRQNGCQASLSLIAKSVAMYSASSSDVWPFPLLTDKGDPNAAVSPATMTSNLWDGKLGTNAMQNFWVMMAQGLSGPSAFHCPSDTRWTPRFGTDTYGWTRNTEFSYGVHFPYDYDAAGNKNPLRLSDRKLNLDLVIMADRNPGGSVNSGRAPSNHPDAGESYARRDTAVSFYRSTGNSNAGANGDDIYVNANGVTAGLPVMTPANTTDTSICPYP